MSERPFSTVGYIHAPEIDVDRMRLETDASLDEGAHLRLTFGDGSVQRFTADEILDLEAETIDQREAEREAIRQADYDALRAMAHAAAKLAEHGEAVDGYLVLSAAVESFLRGDDPYEIRAAMKVER